MIGESLAFLYENAMCAPSQSTNWETVREVHPGVPLDRLP